MSDTAKVDKTQAAIIAAIAAMSPAQKRALLAGTTPPDATAKLSDVLKQFVDGGKEAIERAVEKLAKVATLPDQQAYRAVSEFAPDVAQGMMANSQRRGKPFIHSVHAAIGFLTARIPQ